MVTCAEAILLLSASETTLTVTVAGLGIVAGAVYMPVDEMMPFVMFPPLVPFTAQVTAVFVVLDTTAANC